jgi:hypothetical protein
MWFGFDKIRHCEFECVHQSFGIVGQFEPNMDRTNDNLNKVDNA